ncbi:MAG: shikimate kinase [Planctomycetota bacterium]|nr:shikimate kinase [Planctomycetota bacterium]MEE2886575.1 shikimate kinase [Planctomycetota bacterium]
MTGASLRSVVLVGPRAAGKTTLARLLAERLGYAFADTDELLAASVGCPAGEFLVSQGEPAFRAAEEPVVTEALGSNLGRVLALGGGAVLAEKVRNVLAQSTHFVVFLSAPVSILVDRQASGSFRPPLSNQSLAEEVQTLLRDRQPLYRAVSDLELDTNSLDVHGCQAAILVSMGLGGS